MVKSVYFNVSYDRRADVLYLSTSRDAAARASEDQYGVVWRYAAGDALIGATIMDFLDRWAVGTDKLADRISTRFDVPYGETMGVLQQALKEHHVES